MNIPSDPELLPPKYQVGDVLTSQMTSDNFSPADVKVVVRGVEYSTNRNVNTYLLLTLCGVEWGYIGEDALDAWGYEKI